MAASILSSILSPAKFTIYNQTSAVVVGSTLEVMKVMIKFSSEIQRHPLEDGSTKVDSRIIQPSKMIVDVICKDDDALSAVVTLLSDRTSLYQVTSRGLILQNLMVSSDYFHQAPEMISATPTRISFDQILIQNVNPIVFANSTNASVIDRGLAAVTSAGSTVSDLYTSVTNTIKSSI